MATYAFSNSFCVVIIQTVHHNAYHEDPYAKEFGIKISAKLAQVEARILPAPWVYLYEFSLLFINFIDCRIVVFVFFLF